MPRTNFTTSTPITSDFLNKVARPRISTLDEDGAISPITNSDLANTPGSLLYDFYDYVDALQVMVSNLGGLNVLIKGGVVRKADGTNLTLSDTTVTVPNNQISFISVMSDGTVAVTSIRPAIGYVLASVTSLSGVVTTITDLRVNNQILPQTNIISIFGGQSQTDYIVPASTDITLSGVIDCRNFSLPLGSTIRVNGTLTIRASGNVDIFGNVLTFYPTINPPYSDVTLGGSNYKGYFISGDRTVDSVGYGIRNNRRSAFYNGLFSYAVSSDTTASNAAFYCLFASTVTNFDMAANGGELKINAGGKITIGANVQINMRPKQPTPPASSPSGLLVGSGHSTSGVYSSTYSAVFAYTSSQGAAGNIILQAIQGIEIRTGAVLTCKGSDSGWGFKVEVTQVGTTTQPVALGGQHFKPGAGGGGGIWLHSPTIDSHPSVTYDISAGSMPTPNSSNTYVAGVGGVGKGYSGGQTLNTTTEAKPGTLTTNYSIPVEF